MKPISLRSTRQQDYTVSLDPDLVAKVDKLTDDRDRAIEEALRLWCTRKQDAKLHQLAKLEREQQDKDETGWLI